MIDFTLTYLQGECANFGTRYIDCKSPSVSGCLLLSSFIAWERLRPVDIIVFPQPTPTTIIAGPFLTTPT